MRAAFVLFSCLPVLAQVAPLTCDVSSIPNLVHINGAAELTGDVVIKCTGGLAGNSSVFNFTLFLNVDAASKITNTVTNATEALLLIDEPLPGVPNLSNGCPYAGQMLGTSGIVACGAGSGNVYQGVFGPDNVITWLGVPFVEPGLGATRTLRLTNIRANASNIGIPASNINVIFAASGATSFTINQPVAGTIVASMFDGLVFSTSVPVGAVGVTDLIFQEGFDSAFKKRIENTLGGPLTAVRQDQPGFFYCTESGFIPQFATTTPGDIGSADTGTRLVAEFKTLPASVLFLLMPNEVTSSTGSLVAHRVFPPFTPAFTGGTIPIIPGFSLIPVSAAHTAEVLYEVTASAPFQGVNGCALIESFTIPAITFFPTHLTPAMVSGRFAPVDGTPKSSPTAPRPRFIP